MNDRLDVFDAALKNNKNEISEILKALTKKLKLLKDSDEIISKRALESNRRIRGQINQIEDAMGFPEFWKL